MDSQLINPGVPFCLGVAQHKYLGAEKGLQSAIDGGYSHWYIDASLLGERVEDWTDARIASLQEKIAASVFSQYSTVTSRRRWAAMSALFVRRRWSTWKERSMSPAVWVRR